VITDLTKFSFDCTCRIVLQLRLPARTLFTTLEQRLQALSDVGRDAFCCRLVVFPLAPDLSKTVIIESSALIVHAVSGTSTASPREKT
jgi:hypothetical protein